MMVRAFVISSMDKLNSYPILIEKGWGNGYLIFDRLHPLYKKHYDFLNDSHHMNAHGGWTYSDMAGMHMLKSKTKLTSINDEALKLNDDDWIVGFDTNHFGDSMRNWPKKMVIEHTMELKNYYSKLENFI